VLKQIIGSAVNNNFLAPSNTNVTFASHSTRKTRELCECFNKKQPKKEKIYTSLGFFWNNRITLKININESYIIIIIIIWIGFHE